MRGLWVWLIAIGLDAKTRQLGLMQLEAKHLWVSEVGVVSIQLPGCQLGVYGGQLASCNLAYFN